MNRVTTALLTGILLCQITIVVLMLRERAAEAHLIDDLLRRRQQLEAEIKQQGISLLPLVGAPNAQTETRQVEVLPDGSVRVDGLWLMREKFAELIATKSWSPNTVIHVFAAPSTPAPALLGILDQLRAHDFKQVTIDTR